MLPIEAARASMKDAETAYVAAARAYLEGPLAGTREAAARYHAAMESMVAAYDSMRMLSPKLQKL